MVEKNLLFSSSINNITLFKLSCLGSGYKNFLNPLQDDRILALSKLKAFAVDKFNVTLKTLNLSFQRRKHCGKRRKC